MCWSLDVMFLSTSMSCCCCDTFQWSCWQHNVAACTCWCLADFAQLFIVYRVHIIKQWWTQLRQLFRLSQYNINSQYSVNVGKAMHTFEISGRRADMPNGTIAFRLFNNLLTHTDTFFAHVLAMLRAPCPSGFYVSVMSSIPPFHRWNMADKLDLALQWPQVSALRQWLDISVQIVWVLSHNIATVTVVGPWREA